jgi:hypothetical protein
LSAAIAAKVFIAKPSNQESPHVNVIVGLALKFRVLVVVQFGLLRLAGTAAFIQLNIESWTTAYHTVEQRGCNQSWTGN